MHTTNYFDTFIEVAEDCPATVAEVPVLKSDKKTVANLQFEIVSRNPYQFTSDEVLLDVHAIRKDLADSEKGAAYEDFFAKGQPCFRASPLPKRYGWGIHSDAEGKIALVAVESDEYKQLAQDKNTKHTKAMRSKRG